MKRLQGLLERFRNINPPDRAVQNAAVAAIKKVTGLTLTRASIKVQKGVLYLKTKSVIKSEILLHKKEILSAIKGELKEEKTVVDIC